MARDVYPNYNLFDKVKIYNYFLKTSMVKAYHKYGGKYMTLERFVKYVKVTCFNAYELLKQVDKEKRAMDKQFQVHIFPPEHRLIYEQIVAKNREKKIEVIGDCKDMTKEEIEKIIKKL